MIFFAEHNVAEFLEEEEEEGDIDDTLLGELADDDLVDDDLLDEELDPLLKESAFDELDTTEGSDGLDEDAPKPIDEEGEEDVDDYDSFDDEDEL